MEYFADLPDPRIDRCKEHALIDILTIAILATICGAEHFTQMEEFGKTNQEWLRTFLELKNGIPSHDTFARVFAALKPAAFQERFVRWVQSVRELMGKSSGLMERRRAAHTIKRPASNHCI